MGQRSHRRAIAALAALCSLWGVARADEALPAVDLATLDIEATVPLSLPSLADMPLLAPVLTPVADGAETPNFGARHFRRIVVSDLGPYSAGTFVHHAKAVPLELAALLAYPVYEGVTKWREGGGTFHVVDEGWFGKDTKYLGVDKLGHAFGTYLYADFLTQRIAEGSDDPTGAAITGSLLGFGIQFASEVGDGFSQSQGFSPQDIVFNGLGAGFAFLRNTVPGVAEKVDFRMEYLMPSEFSSFKPARDYSGQKFVMALKFSGFEGLEESPLRFLELQAGYYARGVGKDTAGHGVKRRREPYVGIGFNLNALLQDTPLAPTTAGIIASRALEYYQLPYTYAATRRN